MERESLILPYFQVHELRRGRGSSSLLPNQGEYRGKNIDVIDGDKILSVFALHIKEHLSKMEKKVAVREERESSEWRKRHNQMQRQPDSSRTRASKYLSPDRSKISPRESSSVRHRNRVRSKRPSNSLIF